MDSRAICSELFLDVLDPGVRGVSVPCLPLFGSELCRSRLRLSKSPKLLLPVEVDVRVVAGIGCSSTEGLGEFFPNELIVDDRSLRSNAALVGDVCPECLELGLKNVVAGEPCAFRPLADRGAAWFAAALPVAGLDWSPPSRTPVCAASDVELAMAPNVPAGLREVLEAEASPPAAGRCKCAMGNKGSGSFFLRCGRRNIEDPVVDLEDRTLSKLLWSPARPLDRDDSDIRGRPGGAITPLLAWLSRFDDWLLVAARGRSVGPSKAKLGRLRVKDRASKVFLLSFLIGSMDPASCAGTACCSSPPVDFCPRVDSFRRGCCFCGASRSNVGAVVMISGA
jgi:hypothetical protein